jgi:hypothetical protein
VLLSLWKLIWAEKEEAITALLTQRNIEGAAKLIGIAPNTPGDVEV